MKKWRDASTVIIAARQTFSGVTKGQQHQQPDYKILTARRNVESNFMPNSHVFPGGTLDPEDHSSEWEALYSSLNFANLKLHHDNVTRLHSDRLEIFQTPKTEHLPRYLSLRIAAIRETFEECGILLCRTSDLEKSSDLGHLGSYLVTSKNKTRKLQHQLRDRDHPLNFIEVCRILGCFPDVWSLRECRNWLTPAAMPKRFNTAFFLVALDQTPPVGADNKEVDDLRWSLPKDLLRQHEDGALWLPPPQLYEISKMAAYPTLDGLCRAAASGKFCSEHCFTPVVVPLKDGMVFVMPGDSCYDQASIDPSCYDNETVESFRGLATFLRRLERCEDDVGSTGKFVETKENGKVTNTDLISKM